MLWRVARCERPRWSLWWAATMLRDGMLELTGGTAQVLDIARFVATPEMPLLVQAAAVNYQLWTRHDPLGVVFAHRDADLGTSLRLAEGRLPHLTPRRLLTSPAGDSPPSPLALP